MRRRILIVDSDKENSAQLKAVLSDKGTSVVVCREGKKAVEHLTKGRFDIVMCSERLPDMDGLELFRLVRASHCHAMKILITAYGDRAIVSQAAGMEVDGFIHKPFAPEAIKSSVSLLIEKHG